MGFDPFLKAVMCIKGDCEVSNAEQRSRNPTNYRLSLASLMPPISPPPQTCRRLAAASAQVHPILSVLHALFVLLLIISVHLSLFLSFLWDSVHPTSLPFEVAQPASPPLSDDTVDSGPVGTAMTFALLGVLFIMIFLLFLIRVLSIVLDGPAPPENRSIALFMVLLIISLLLSLLLSFLWHNVHPTSLPSEAAQPASPPLSDDTADYGPFVRTAVAFALLGVLYIMTILLLRSMRPVPPDYRRIAPLPAPYGGTPIRAPCGLDPAVCRANLTSQFVVHPPSQLPVAGTEPPRVEVKVEASPPDGGAPERSPREDDLVRKRLIDGSGPVLPLESCSRGGYRCGGGGGGEGSNPGTGRYYFRSPDRLDRATKSERWLSSTVAADGGGGVL